MATRLLRRAALATVTDEVIADLVAAIVARFDPVKIVLFGSRAWGRPRPDSDIDLLVIVESDLPPTRRSAEMSIACRPRGVAVDFLVKTPSEVARRLQLGDPFIRRILDEGRVLHAR